MTLEDAIEILELHYIALYQFLNKEYEDAVKLGIEALNQLKRERAKKVGFWKDRLPGETKE